MANPFMDFIEQRLIKPNVDKATANLRSELRRTQDKLEIKEFDVINDISSRFGARGNQNKTQLLNTWVSWVYANISVIAERVADIQFEMFSYKLDSNGEELDEQHVHPLLDLLYRVNDYQTKWDLIYIWTMHMLSLGEAAWYLVGMNSENSKPTELWPLRPDLLKIIPGNLANNQFIEAYEYRLPGRDVIVFKPWEVLFFKSPHPTNPYRGYGILEAAMTDVKIDEAANNYNRAFFENFARPDAVLMTDSKLTQEVYDRLQKTWNAKYQGTDNAGKMAILENGLKFEAIQPSAKDMDFLEQQRWTRDKLMALFKNTKVILGITEDVNRANAEASEAVWIKHNIKPKMQRLVDCLNEWLVPLYGPNLILGFEDPSPQSVELKVSEYTAAVDKWMTRNEIREQEGLDPVEGGDYLYVTLTQSPLGQQPTPQPQGNQNGQDKPQKPDDMQDGEGDMGMADEMPKHLKLKVQKSSVNKNIKLLKQYRPQIQSLRNRAERDKTLRKAVNKAINAAIKTVTPKKGTFSYDIQSKRWETFVKIAGVFEMQMQHLIQAIISSHKDEALNLINQNYKPKPKYLGQKEIKGIGDLLPEQDKYVKVSVDAIRPILLALAAEQGSDIYDFLGMHTQFLTTEEVLKAIQKFALEASDSYIGTMADRIRQELIDGVSAGEGIEKLSKRLTEAYSGFTENTAKRVARTETIRAANYATEEAFKQSGIVTGKQWFTAMDERVDDECAALDGKIVELDGDFRNLDDVSDVYSDVGFPPLHPNCRCTISPVIVSKSTKPKTKKPRPYRKTPINVAKLKAEIRAEVEKEHEEKLDKILQRINHGD